MSRRSQSLKSLAYKAIPAKVRKDILSDPSRKEQSVLLDVRSELMQEYKENMKKWGISARIPVKIQGILILANHFTKPDFFNAFENFRKNQFDETSFFNTYGDYFDGFTEFLYIKNNDFLKIASPRRHHQLEKWHFLVEKTFYLLCYRRLNHIFKLHEDFPEGQGYFSQEFMNVIFALPDTEILPLVIYKLLDKNYDTEQLRH